MHYEVEIGGRIRQVAVTRTGDTFAVTVDGHTRTVDAARIDAHTLSLLVDSVDSSYVLAGPHPRSITRSHRGARAYPEQDAVPGPRPRAGPDNASVRRAGYEVSIAGDAVSGQLAVHVGAVPIAATLNGRRRWGRKDDGRGSGSGPQRLIAPMPGKVVRVLVEVGDAVRARQPIVVVEAMKMENELRASREGTVAEIHVREGMSVDAGALLIVIQ